jgi:uncharacterized protein (TIGR02145 family)
MRKFVWDYQIGDEYVYIETTDEYGFGIAPTGSMFPGDGTVEGHENWVNYWTSVEGDSVARVQQFYRKTKLYYPPIRFGSSSSLLRKDKFYGESVRCIKSDTLKTLPSIEIDSVKQFFLDSLIIYTNLINEGSERVFMNGLCYSTQVSSTIENDSVLLINGGRSKNKFAITNLAEGGKYYLKAFATNKFGTAYSNELVQIFLQYDSVVDVEGNVFGTVKLGGQVWMTENLKTTKFADGSDIPLVLADTSWLQLSLKADSRAYCYDSIYRRLENYSGVYEKNNYFYTYNAALSVCPVDWSLPDKNDWNELFDFIGPDNASKIMEKSVWNFQFADVYYDLGTTNDYGFGIAPTGKRESCCGDYIQLHEVTVFWTRAENATVSAQQSFYRKSIWDSPLVEYGVGSNYYESNERWYGQSIRCIKDSAVEK